MRCAQPSGVATFIELYELGARRRARLYAHSERINVTSASLNVDRTLLRTPCPPCPHPARSPCLISRHGRAAAGRTVITTCTRHQASLRDDDIMEATFEGSGRRTGRTDRTDRKQEGHDAGWAGRWTDR